MHQTNANITLPHMVFSTPWHEHDHSIEKAMQTRCLFHINWPWTMFPFTLADDWIEAEKAERVRPVRVNMK